MGKCVIELAGAQAKDACGSLQLCTGMEAGIEGAVHASTSMCSDFEDDYEWGFLLIDAKNGFNEINRHCMVWTARHLWPAGARFLFNTYRHWARLVFRQFDGEPAQILHSKEGSTQGDPVAGIAYGLATMPLNIFPH